MTLALRKRRGLEGEKKKRKKKKKKKKKKTDGIHFRKAQES